MSMNLLRRSASLVLFPLLVACATTTPTALPREAVPPARDTNALAPLATAPREIPAPRIRVGLATDEPRAEFPRVEGGWIIQTDAGPSSLRRGFTVEAPRAGAPVRWAVRVATLPTREAAETEAIRVRGMTSAPVEILEDAAAQWRVIVGDFETSAAGGSTRDELLRAGIRPPIYVVRRPSVEPVRRELVLTDDEGNRHTLAGESILVVPATRETMAIAGKPYRGGARLFINDRGLLNVINVVNLEDYLRGVVPGELGPRTYDELEAQKAQAIAARTYAVRRLGDFAAEGYDICPTAACQVYAGFSIEEPLSSQAIDATTGLVMTWNGQPIDALFTSTCGGATSDVSTMFPGRDDPYLKRARCVELDLETLAGRRQGEIVGEREASATIFAALAGLSDSSAALSAREVIAAVEATNALIGFTPAATVAPPRSATRGEVLDYLSRMWTLSATGRVLTLPEDRTYFFGAGAADDPRAAAQSFLIKYGVTPAQAADDADLGDPMPRTELYALLLSWAEEVGAVSDVQGRVTAIDGSTLQVKLTSGTREVRVPPGIPVFRRFHEQYREEAAVPVLVSDRARVISNRAGSPVALVIEANYDGASFDRTSGFANWTRSYRAPQLVEFIAKRVPIRELRGLRPLETDASDRVARMEVQGEDGRAFVLEGIQVRFALELPDNLFVFVKTRDSDGVDRYTFFGKGWGHGTGMCQIGAYGMAFRGETAEEILKHYYTGIEIGQVPDRE